NLVTSVYYHHAKEENRDNVKAYYDKYMKQNVSLGFEKSMKPSHLYKKYVLFSYPNQGFEDFNWPSYAKLKGLLQKCDYAASANIGVLERFNIQKRRAFLKTIEKTIELNSLQKFMKQNVNQNVIVIAPTGMGKTEASFLWSNLDKTFYTLPLRVASNAIYNRARKKYHYQEVSLLHSSAFNFLNKEWHENQTEFNEKFKITKQLGDSLTILTIDQLFKFPLKALGHELLFATLTYSKVIIDEIQMYSSTIIASIIIGLKYLVQEGGKFAITTATLPPIFLDLLNEHLPKMNGYQLKKFSDSKLSKRHRIKLLPYDFSYDLIIEQAKKHKVLVICNTVIRAQEVFDKLKNIHTKVNLLHSKFIKKDRQEKENQILSLKNNGIWVCTQIVEASLDLDFDILHTDLSPADSLFQRMGRCYRKRNIDHSNPNIYIYDTKIGLKEGKKGVYDKFIYELTWRFLKNFDNQILKEDAKCQIIEKIYNAQALENSFYLKDLKQKIKSINNCYPGKYDQKRVDEIFRDIEDITIIPDKIYEENKNEIERLKASYLKSTGLEKLNELNKLLEYTLQIPSFHRTKCTNFLDNQIYRIPYDYNKEKGIIFEV
ncbi:MAG: CRISPR-associated helicase Cas3', partial [Bacilli bacterium]|nr:CRISPR-associated helicase Cas3' [Bacilli bacterium]